MNTQRRWILAFPLLAAALAVSQPDPHHADGHADQGAIVMSARERAAQGVQTARVSSRVVDDNIVAPGEVVLNAYQSVQVTPRIPAQVLARHARLGDVVAAGARLVTLSSVEMAAAQGTLIEADREWDRVRDLGRGVVSEARFIEAEVARQRAYATARAYGLTEDQIAALLSDGDASRATGEFALLSPRAGTVIRDPFIAGEVVEPGQLLFTISDESSLWVEAQLRSEQAGSIAIDAPARVSRDGDKWLEGRVTQFQHRLDEKTRTRGVRLDVPNPDHVLHPGDYVEVAIEARGVQVRAAVPEEAVLLMEGNPVVFRVEGDTLFASPVEPGITSGGWTEIAAGLEEGDEIVVQGAFLLKSLALKSRMGAGHAH